MFPILMVAAINKIGLVVSVSIIFFAITNGRNENFLIYCSICLSDRLFSMGYELYKLFLNRPVNFNTFKSIITWMHLSWKLIKLLSQSLLKNYEVFLKIFTNKHLTNKSEMKYIFIVILIGIKFSLRDSGKIIHFFIHHSSVVADAVKQALTFSFSW